MNMGTLAEGSECTMGGVRTIPFDTFKRNYLVNLGRMLKFSDPMHNSFFILLSEMPFTWSPSVPNDEHRESDGRDLRRLYAEDACVEVDPRDADQMELWEASVLEVLVSLAMAATDSSVHQRYSPRDGVEWWFWRMVTNLGIVDPTAIEPIRRDNDWKSMPDLDLTRKSIVKWLERRYSRTGKGGIFPVPKTRKDQRRVELWYQLAEYLDYIDA